MNEPPELVQNPETSYTGDFIGQTNRNRIVVSSPEERDYLLPPRTDIEKLSTNHTYDAFTWGYKGAGPHLTAGSLLADMYQDRNVARELKRDLVESYVSNLGNGEEWQITASDIHSMLTEEN